MFNLIPFFLNFFIAGMIPGCASIMVFVILADWYWMLNLLTGSVLIVADKLAFHYNRGVPVLKDISFQCEDGQIMGLLGHNGSGKTTLLKLIGRLMLPSEGSLALNGRDYMKWPEDEFFNRTGLLVEEPAFYGHLSLEDNLRIQAAYRGIPAATIQTVLKRVEADPYKHKKTSRLSTGMKQRAGIASLLLHDPDILLLDEPTNGLDPEGIIHIREILLELKRQGKTLIVSSHLLSEIEKISDQILILEKGKVVFRNSVEALKGYRDLEELYISLKS